MFPLNSNDQYIDENGKRASLGELFEGSEHDIEQLETTVAGHTTQIGNLQTKTGALQDQISTDEYSAESGYNVGDYVIHDNKLYKCNTTCTADTWANNSGYFTETSVTDEITTLNSDCADLKASLGYSLSETITDSKWIDDKTIYRKVINFGSLPSEGNKSIAHNIINIDKVISIRGYITNGINYYPLPMPNPAIEYSQTVWVDSTNITIKVGDDRSGSIAYVILDYTKT